MNRKTMFMLFVFLSFAWQLQAQSAQGPLNVDAPESVVAGQLVRLDPNLDSGESAIWDIDFPYDLDAEQLEDGRLIFAVPCESVKQIVLEVFAQRIEGDRIVTRKKRILLPIQAGDVRPDPSDNNGDGKPGSGEPIGFDENRIRQLAMKLSIEIKDLNTANRLADAYRRVAELDFETVDELLAAAAASRGEVMATRPRPLKNWMPALQEITTAFKKLELSKPEHVKRFLKAVADGFSRALPATTTPLN